MTLNDYDLLLVHTVYNLGAKAIELVRSINLEKRHITLYKVIGWTMGSLNIDLR